MSIKRKIGAVIAGWFLAMIVAIVRGIVRRALAKQARSAQQAQQTRQSQGARESYSSASAAPARSPAFSKAPFKSWAVTDTIYQGMSRSELVATYGEPAGRAAGQSMQEIWTYAPRRSANDNGGTLQPGMTVVLDGGVVSSWTEDVAA